jgi:hypothetical protein
MPTTARSIALNDPDAGRDHGTCELRFETRRHDQVDDDLIDRLLALYARTFSRWPSLDPEVPLRDHLRWKISSPGTTHPVIAGWLGTELVTARLIIHRRIWVKGRERLWIDSPDLAVDTRHQGRGYSKASQAFTRQVTPDSDFQLDDSVNARVWKSRMRAHARPLANRLRILYLAPASARLRNGLLPQGPAPAAVALAGLRAVSAVIHGYRSRRHPVSLGSSPRTVTRFDQRADTFGEQAAAAFDLIDHVCRERLEWRYCDRRAGPFVVRTVDEDGAMLGYAVHRLGRPRGMLVDLLALPGREDVAEALARDAVTQLVESGCAEVICWLPHAHPYRAVLQRVGFLTLPRSKDIRWRPERLAPAELEFLDSPDARVHFMMGSTDLV